MRDYVYFWVEKCQYVRHVSGKEICLFDDFAVNLSSKYTITHKWDKNKRIFSFESCCNNGYMISSLKNNFYSENIVDLKVVLGNNGAGKSSLMDILADIISKKNIHNEYTYILVWEERDCFYYFLHKGEVYDREEKKKGPLTRKFCVKSKVPFYPSKKIDDAVIFYSSAFPNYWPKIDFKEDCRNIYDIRTKTLLKKNIEDLNRDIRIDSTKNGLISFYQKEENKIIDYVLDFYDIKKEGKLFLADTLALPTHFYFNLSEENINDGIQELVEKVETTELERRDLTLRYSNFFKSLKKFEDQIKFACIINEFRKEIYCLDSEEVINKSAFTFENISQLDDFLKNIHFYLNEKKHNQIYEKVLLLIKCLEPFKLKRYHPSDTFVFWMQIEKSKKKIENIRNILRELELEHVTHIMDVEWGRPLSSGEQAYLTFFGRLYSCLKEYKVNIKSFYKRNGKEFKGCLFLDEMDLYLHPEWQRMWFDKFIDGLSLIKEKLKMPLKIQLFMVTHSPFMVTDFSSESILTLQREKFENGEWGSTTVKTNVLQKTMAGNIYDVLDSGFILDGTLGCFVEKKIKELLNRIKEKRTTANDLEFIEQIGDPIIHSIVSNRMRSKND